MPIRRRRRIVLRHLRGYGLPITTPAGEDIAVEWLREDSVDHWIIDPIGPVLDWCGLDENDNTHVKRLTVALDRIKARAGVADLTIGAHPKRNGEEYVRGAVRWSEWADAIWAMSWDGSRAFFRVIGGRDVPKWRDSVQIEYDAASRMNTLKSITRRAGLQKRDAAEVCAILAEDDGLKAGELRARVSGDKSGRRDDKIQAAISLGWVRVEVEGQGKPTRHYLVSRDWEAWRDDA
jgi:hypothetical protein